MWALSGLKCFFPSHFLFVHVEVEFILPHTTPLDPRVSTFLVRFQVGFRPSNRVRERELNQDMRQSSPYSPPSSPPVISARWEISPSFPFSHDSTAGTRRQQPRWPWSSDYSLNMSWHCQERAVWWLRLSNDSCCEELLLTVAHTSRARPPFEVITRSLYSGEANDVHFNLSITKKRNLYSCFLLAISTTREGRKGGRKKGGGERKKRRLFLM